MYSEIVYLRPLHQDFRGVNENEWVEGLKPKNIYEDSGGGLLGVKRFLRTRATDAVTLALVGTGITGAPPGTSASTRAHRPSLNFLML